jgi:hypothetical protein
MIVKPLKRGGLRDDPAKIAIPPDLVYGLPGTG